ncbi:hypothetical protein Poli38472_004943 [Pythium oligandrum]|uniref:Uncharacterized protein n=1 Tax=Pythium oligandrum TaxID=41045 RepID=A0A8K1CAQ4_PYTOL|nr:hypothetical protein Poli38472_004943 [Pythium oligandrum]|eukprot:TMW59874.1 hypothetical protein Poli38472_004943 [Pythium oligandrum]
MVGPDDDSALVDVVLGLLDDWSDAEGDADASSESDRRCSHVATAESGDSTGKSRRKRRRTSHSSSLARWKEEIQRLRGEAEALESTLGGLRARIRNNTVESGIRRQEQELWRAIALRQRRARERVEGETRKLRARIQAHFEAARDFTAALGQGTREKSSTVDLSMLLKSGTSDEEMVKRLERLYQHTDVAFTAEKFHNGTLSFREDQVRFDRNTTVIDAQDAWIVPFPLREIDEVLWETAREKSIWEDFDYYMEQTVSKDTIVAAYTCVTVTDSMVLGGFRGKVVLKRFCCPDQPSVIVTALYSESLGSTTRQAMVYEVSWIRAKEVTSEYNQSFTQVQVSRQTQIQYKGLETCENPGEVSRAVTEQVRQEINLENEMRQELVENFLLRRQAEPAHSSHNATVARASN